MSELIEITTTDTIEVAGAVAEQLVVTQQLAALEIVDVGSQGPQGPQGDVGPAGPQGEVGPAGPAGAVSAVSGTAPIVSSGGATPAISISAATTSAAGSMSATDKTKLDGLSNYTHPASHAPSIITQDSSNRFVTDAEKAAWVTLTGAQTLTDKTIEAALLTNGYTEEVYAVSGTTPALSPANGSIQTWALSASSTPTAGTWAAGQSITLMIDDGTAYAITWTSLAVVWKTDGGTAPTLNTTGYTVIALWKVGTTIYGARVGDA